MEHYIPTGHESGLRRRSQCLIRLNESLSVADLHAQGTFPKRTMKRRNFVGGSLLVATGSVLAGCQSTSSSDASELAPRVNWRLASSFPSSLDTLFGGSQAIADKVSDLTSGRFSVEVFQAGELVPGLEVMDAVQAGSVEMGHTSGSYYVGKDSALSFEAAIPFGLNARQHNAWLYSGNGLTLLREVLERFNIISFPGGNTGAQMGGWFRRPINGLSDLQGLRMRAPGLGGEVLSELGVSVQLIAAGEVFQALDRGALDATEFVGPHDDLKLGFDEVATHYYYPGWWEPSSAASFYINRESWDSLPEPYQRAVQYACDSVNVEMLARYDANNAEAFQQIREGATSVQPFPEDVIARAYTVTQRLLEEKAEANAAFRRIYEDWLSFRDLTSRWFATAELAVDQSAAELRV